jgi:hypothetical protein
MNNAHIDSKLCGEVSIVKSDTNDSIITWLKANQDEVKQLLIEDGGVILRGFEASSEDSAEVVLSILGHELLDDAYWSTPRSGVAKKTFTATEYPKEKTIALHSEMAYMPIWPRLVAFHSLIVEDQGGETTICNIDKFSQTISDLLPDFLDKGVLYKRTFQPNIDIPWQKAFQTNDPKKVKKIADKIGMEVEWFGDDVLQTSHKLQGCVLSDDETPLWFNQSHIFHTTNIPKETLATLKDLLGEDRLPRSAFYGDGTIIPEDVIERINQTLDEQTIKVPWQVGDVLIIDNMRYSHGRMPFEGGRKLHVALADSTSLLNRTPLFSQGARTEGVIMGVFARLKKIFF